MYAIRSYYGRLEIELLGKFVKKAGFTDAGFAAEKKEVVLFLLPLLVQEGEFILATDKRRREIGNW